jgi:hypothetical protein
MPLMISYDRQGAALARWAGPIEELKRIAEKEKKKSACAKILIGTKQIYP